MNRIVSGLLIEVCGVSVIAVLSLKDHSFHFVSAVLNSGFRLICTTSLWTFTLSGYEPCTEADGRAAAEAREREEETTAAKLL